MNDASAKRIRELLESAGRVNERIATDANDWITRWRLGGLAPDSPEIRAIATSQIDPEDLDARVKRMAAIHYMTRLSGGDA